MLAEGEKLKVGNWITEEKPASWYNYNESKWANIYVENNGVDVYYTWIPRYCYKVDDENSITENERTDVKFIDIYNNYKDEDGNVTTWGQLKEEGYKVPAAFRFNGTKLPGYWAMKYTCGDKIDPSIIYYKMVASKGNIIIRNISLNTSITNSNPITKYTFAINGEIVETIEDSSEITNIADKIITFTNIKDGENVINVTGLNANEEIVGSTTKIYKLAKPNEPELKEFDQNTTFYVTYNENGIEESVIPINKEAPQDWYNYSEARWANIVTRNNGLETYYTWIPRYGFTIDAGNEESVVTFVEGTNDKMLPANCQVPEAFTFNGKELTGYWAMKYTCGDEIAPLFSTELASTSNSIKTKGITGTNVADGQVYRYYINGEYKYETTNKNEHYEYTNLNNGEIYTILVEIRNKETNQYLGTIVDQIRTVEPNKPELIGFNAEITYYVTYQKDESTGELKEVIGENITNDGSNVPNGWYDYSESMWANIVVTDGNIQNGQIVGATVVTYYTWIPRYEYKVNPTENQHTQTARAHVRFIQGTETQVDKGGWLVPEAFNFANTQLTGYWAMKYTVGE